MDNSFTDFLLATLIGLVAYIGNKVIQSVQELRIELKNIRIKETETLKDIHTLRKDVDDHEERLRDAGL